MAKPFSVQCPNCEARLKIQNPKAVGKKVRCPNCENPFTVKPPRASAPPQDEFDLEEYDDEDYDDYDRDELGPPRRSGRRSAASRPSRGAARRSPRGKKRPRKNSNAQVALIAGGAVLAFLLLVGLGFLIYQLAGGQAVEYAWLPPDSEMVVSIDVDDVWNSSLAKRILNNPDAGELKRSLEELKELGFQEGESVEAIDSITAGFTDMDRRNKGLAVIRKKTPWNVEAIKNKERLREESRDGKTYYADFGTAYYFPDAKTLVVGDKEVVEAALDRGPDSNIGEKFSFLPKGQIVVGLLPANPDDFTRKLALPPMLGLLLGGKEYFTQINEGIKGITGGALTLEFGNGVEVEVVAKCSNPDVADKLAGGFQEAIADVRRTINKEREKLNQKSAQQQEGFHLADTVVNTLAAHQSGDNVTLSVEVSSSVIDRAERLAKEVRGGRGRGPQIPFNFNDFFGKVDGRKPDRPAPDAWGWGAVGDARKAALQSQPKNHLKQIAVAMHNSHDTFRSLALLP